MRWPGGYAVITDRVTGAKRECDTISCCHCNRVVFVKAGQDPQLLGGWCAQCGKHVCGPCADDGTCKPLMRRIEEMESRGRMLQAVGIG